MSIYEYIVISICKKWPEFLWCIPQNDNICIMVCNANKDCIKYVKNMSPLFFEHIFNNHELH